MTNLRLLAVIVSVSIFLGGCAGKRIKIDPSNPLYQPKNEFERNYGFFVTPDERKIGHTVSTEICLMSEPVTPFNKIDTLDEFRKFEKHFWCIRDTDPNTPQNEYKELIDSRLRDIQNEIFAMDLDIPGTRFNINGGLKGDLAHVFLLHGAPLKGYKFKLSEGIYHVELVAWYYLDYQGRHLMRFLFYDNNSKLQLFKDPFPLISFEELLNPAFSPLKKLSNRPGISTLDEMVELWQELERNDPEWIFRAPLFEFSDYTHIDKDTRWTIDRALAPPEPAALTAVRFKPTILGQPNIPEGVKLFKSDYRSFLPAYIRTNVSSDNPTFLMIIILRKNVDWAKQDNEKRPYAANLNLRISFQNKKTLKLTEFMTYYRFELSQEEFDKRDQEGEMIGSVVTRPVTLPHFDGENLGPTLEEILKKLEPGEYVINIYLQHTLTKKYNAWREEIVVK